MPKIKCTTNFENETITMKTKEFDRFIDKVKKEIKKKIRTATAKEIFDKADEIEIRYFDKEKRWEKLKDYYEYRFLKEKLKKKYGVK